MSARIRELEEALQHAHADKSDDPHSLFSSVAAQGSVEKSSSHSTHVGAPSSTEPESESFIDALGIPNNILQYRVVTQSLGTLTIGTRGETNFMSSTARAEVCLITYIMVLVFNCISCILLVSYRGNSGPSISGCF